MITSSYPLTANSRRFIQVWRVAFRGLSRGIAVLVSSRSTFDPKL